MFAQSHLRNAAAIVALYPSGQPFSLWLKHYFRQHKKFGSKDRRAISHLCFCYFRLGNAFADHAVTDRMMRALFLCSEHPNDLLGELNPSWNEAATMPPQDKFALLGKPDEALRIFPWNDALSTAIDVAAFNSSLLLQPKVYLRIRPGKKKMVQGLLEKHKISYESINENCIAVAQHTVLDEVLKPDELSVVQDLSSQKVFQILDSSALLPNTSVWDCCAASGGKSLLYHDLFSYRQLTVSDVRENILHNLRARFQRAGIKNFRAFVADMASPQFLAEQEFDVIICDAPCSGSGTWSRTPEQLLSFKESQIEYYASLQKKIVTNAAKCLKRNGQLLYITCSVFSRENEEVVHYLKTEQHLQLKAATYYKGYDQKADTLFAALFTL